MKKLRKLIIIIFIFFCTFYLFMDVSFAEVKGIVNEPLGIFVRKGPGTENDSVTLLKYGTEIQLVNTTTKPGNGCSGWYQINYNGSTDRYVCSEFVVLVTDLGNTNSTGYYTSSTWGYRINEDYASVRNKASSNGTRIELIYLGTQVKILESITNSTDSACKNWYKISYYNNKTGYVCSRLISNYNEITAIDEEYNKVLQKEGFPESYWPFLTYLHKKHPTWVFTVSLTNKNFDDVVTGEAGKNAMQTVYSSYRISNVLREAPNWYTTTNAVNAFYLDPRNYLTERNIFAFELLQYDKDNHLASSVKSIFGESYLATDDYVSYFMKAANDYNISPIHLAARAKQEGMTNADYVMVSGTASTVGQIFYNKENLDGVYNYYNIGSFGDIPVARGLAAAKGLVDNYTGTPWDTREKAIVYGARFIANNYVNAGQNTLYYQKFNTGPGASFSSYTHQYMTNIIAPAGESLSTYSSYVENNLLETPFVFAIPVYKETPTDFTMHPPVGETNTELSNIKVNNSNVNGFDSDVLTYTHYIAKNSTSVNISATSVSSKAIISGIGDIPITEDETDIEITVTSEIGTSKIYTLTLIKSDAPTTEETTIEELLTNVDVKITNGYMSGIEINTIPTTLANSINIKAPDAIVTITDSNDVNKTESLATGDKITIKNGINEKTYTIIIKGDNNGDGKINTLDLLRVQKHILKYTTLTDSYKESCDTNYDNKVDTLDLLLVQKHILGYIKLK